MLKRALSVMHALLPILTTACAWVDADVKTRTETATSNRHEYTIEMGGTMDGVNTRSPRGFRPWRQRFKPNVSVRMENVGDVPVKYKIYGSDEKGFTVSDTPYEILYRSIARQPKVQGKFGYEMKEMPANFACETTKLRMIVIGPDVNFPNANRAYYRVVAVDENGIESGPSGYAAARCPFIYTLPPAGARVGRKWTCQVGATSSLGDLRSRSFAPEYSYNLGFWDKDAVHYHLHGAPAWLKIDERTGVIFGTPGRKDVGGYCFMVYADIPKVACDSQVIELEVQPE